MDPRETTTESLVLYEVQYILNRLQQSHAMLQGDGTKKHYCYSANI